MGLYELNKNLRIARQKGFRFNQIHKLTIKINSHQRYINMRYYLKFQIPMCHRIFFKKISQNPDYVKTHCNDRKSHLISQFVNGWLNKKLILMKTDMVLVSVTTSENVNIE